MAPSARALLLSTFTPDILNFRHSLSLKSRPHLLFLRPSPSGEGDGADNRRRHQILRCVFSSGGGESVADDFVSTRKSAFRREFSVLANVLKQIDPLDASVIAKGVSSAAKDSMKRTISTMLGLLPSDQFAVSIRVSRNPLRRLLASSIITGYTLWNAEYRVCLTRNFDNSPDSEELGSNNSQGSVVLVNEAIREAGEPEGDGLEEFERKEAPRFLGDLSPEAVSYIQTLKLELESIEKKLNAQKQENIPTEGNREENNDLLEYLRSLEPNMVIELSRPSSSEVEEIIQQLVQNVLKRLFKSDDYSGFPKDSIREKKDNCADDDIESCATIRTPRDYLAKLLFWCMLLGHHMRGLEYRLQLSCAVGLL